jgi:hemerythrin
MPLFIWNENYKIGVPEIDKQHQYLMGAAHDLHEAILNGHGHDHIEKVLNKLVDYVEFHFSTEEDLMKKVEYPETDEHCLEHLSLKTRIIYFRQKFTEGSEPLSEYLMLFLRDWLENHITVVDKKVGSYLSNS